MSELLFGTVLGSPVVLPRAEVLAAGGVAGLDTMGEAESAFSMGLSEEAGNLHVAEADRHIHEPVIVVAGTITENPAAGEPAVHLLLHRRP